MEWTTQHLIAELTCRRSSRAAFIEGQGVIHKVSRQ